MSSIFSLAYRSKWFIKACLVAITCLPLMELPLSITLFGNICDGFENVNTQQQANSNTTDGRPMVVLMDDIRDAILV